MTEQDFRDALPRFRAVEISDRELFRSAAARQLSDSCEWSFLNLFCWGKIENVKFLPDNNNKRIYLYNSAMRLNPFPVGEAPEAAELVAMLRAFQSTGLNPDGTLYDLPQDYFEAHRDELEKHLEISCDEGEFDYIYDNEKLCGMSGAKLRKKRNLIRQFERNNPEWSVEKITPENLDYAIELAAELNAKLPQCGFISEENEVMEVCRENFFSCGAEGIILFSRPGNRVGFSIFSAINSECADIHFEKADHEVTGASQMLTWQTAQALRPSYLRMNREQDMGEEGLRRAKNSLDPLTLYRRLSARLKQTNI